MPWVAVIVGACVALFGLLIVLGRPAGLFDQELGVSERHTRGAICLAFGIFIAVAFALRIV